MSQAAIYSLLSVLIVSGISLVGALTFVWKDSFLKKILFVLVSLATGALFGDAIIHLIPETFELVSGTTASVFILSGILVFFILEKFLHWHHSHGEHDEGLHGSEIAKETGGIKPVGIMVIVSDGVHNFIDGAIIATGFSIGFEVGMATTIAIILHEIPQEMGDFGLLIHAGFSKGRALLLNFASAAASFLGVGLVIFLGSLSDYSLAVLSGFAAGNFLYLAGSDLIPELHKNRDLKSSFIQFLGIVIGVAVMFLLAGLE